MKEQFFKKIIFCLIFLCISITITNAESYHIIKRYESPKSQIYKTGHNNINLLPASFKDLYGWKSAKLAPVLEAFRQSCRQRILTGYRRKKMLGKYSGNFRDWQKVCNKAFYLENTEIRARQFFEKNFKPFFLYEFGKKASYTGLLTGYYEPIIDVNPVKTSVFSEPILGLPERLHLKKKNTKYYTRKKITKNPKNILAWGRPSEVFFLQIQGSGRIVFKDGRQYRVAFAGHNGHKYKSIGKELIRRGEISATRLTKQSIEAWMYGAGERETKALMDYNPRYVFFKLEPIGNNRTGPIGAQGVSLRKKASLAIDQRYHDFGVPVWLETNLPMYTNQGKNLTLYNNKLSILTDQPIYRIYKISESNSNTMIDQKKYQNQKPHISYQKKGLLTITQDSGSAIKGVLRGDLFFGTGKTAGFEAGIMKNEARWAVLLPHSVARKYR